jgi:DNA-binding transcriptional LysR family regulator
MNYKSINFDWNKVKAFLVTAQEGSFSAAARKLNTTQTTIGRQVHALEQELSIILFEKVGKGLELTPAGLDILEEVKKMAIAASELSIIAAGKNTEIEGTVCITGSESTSVFVLPKVIEKLSKVHPKIKIEVMADNKSNDLLRREADIAIRHYRPKSGDLIVKKLREDKGYFYASRSYMKKLKNPDDVNFIGFIENSEYISNLKSIGLNLKTKNFSVFSENHIVHYELMKAGIGVGVLPEYVGSSEKKLVKVFEELPPFPIETWIVVHRELNTNIKVRTVFDFLVNELQIKN